jgi:hypothetical protein
MMLKNLSRARLVGAWFGLVALVLVGSLISGVAVSAGNIVLWSVVCLLPPAVMLSVWRAGAQPVTMNELLFSADRPAKEGRP